MCSKTSIRRKLENISDFLDFKGLAGKWKSSNHIIQYTNLVNIYFSKITILFRNLQKQPFADALCWCLFLNKVANFRVQLYLKRYSSKDVCEIFQNTFTDLLQTIASEPPISSTPREIEALLMSDASFIKQIFKLTQKQWTKFTV